MSLLETAIAQARRWLVECDANHPSCGRKARHSHIFCTDNMHLITDLPAEGLIPSRLLAFPLKPSSPADDVVRLATSASLPVDTTFVALSHRWGENEDCKTTHTNLQQLQEQGIPVAELPRTFREAVLVARGLGISRLWIDSLCIVQGDEEDWKDEAARMAIIYDHAACTIAAMDGVDSNSGLFIADVAKREVGLLNSRAWVCQEQMIAPRTLLFTNDTVAWECRECDASLVSPTLRARQGAGETVAHPKDLFVFFRDWRLPPLDANEIDPEAPAEEDDGDESRRDGATAAENAATLVQGTGAIARPRPDKDPEAFGSYAQIVTNLLREPSDYVPFLKAWWEFISLYTPRQLTYGKDKFLAMKGITSVAQRWTHLRSTFGLWYHFFEKEMVWHIDTSGPPATRAGSWLAPTWSWASTRNGRVVNKYYRRLPKTPTLYLKPQFTLGVGTSFDSTLPFPAWLGREFHGIELKGDLRKGVVTTTRRSDGVIRYSVDLEPCSKFSEHEKHDFRPDCAANFPVGAAVHVLCLLVWHYDARQLDMPQYIDVRLVLQQAQAPADLSFQKDDVPKIDMLDERTMRRVGYMETTYDVTEKRDDAGIYEDISWFYVRLV